MKSVFLLLVILSSICYSQKEANNWYFGENAGITFNTPDGSPVAITNGKLNTTEGCATISDKNGNLLFYTDGVTVWNKQHAMMDNGFDLKGHESSTQSALIIPKINDGNKYYIFTIPTTSSFGGLCYSIVDMNENSGLGKITNKNVMIKTNACEKLTAVKHSNNRDYWIIIHGWLDKNFYAYLLSETGLSSNPVISSTGSIHTGDAGSLGYLKASPNGSKLACCIYDSDYLEIFNFENTTGSISYITHIAPDSVEYNGPYGVEFSPSGGKLYVSIFFRPSKIIQYDLTSNNSNDIINSAFCLDTFTKSYYYGALQLGSDKKIYASAYNHYFLAVINNPEVKGRGCYFIREAVSLNGKRCQSGLPTFMQSFFAHPGITSNAPICEGDTLYLSATKIDSVYYKWILPDNSVIFSDNYKIPNSKKEMSGKYILETWSDNFSDTIRQEIDVTVFPNPDINIFPKNTELCANEVLALKVVPFDNETEYTWSTGGKGDSIVINKSGKYFVTAKNKFGCSKKDSAIVTFNPLPNAVITIEGTKILCNNDSVVLCANPKGNNYSYSWSTGSAAQSITVNESGIFKLIVTNEFGCADTSDDVEIIKKIDEFEISSSLPDEIMDFGSVLFSKDKCKNISVKNITGDTIEIGNIYFLKNNYFSIPPSQFPIILPEYSSKEIIICFTSGNYGDLTDTLVFEDNCTHYKIPCLAQVPPNEYLGSTDCGLKLKFDANELVGKESIVSEPFPNPFSEATIIDYYIFEESHVSLKLFSVLGSDVFEESFGIQKKGFHSINIESRDLPEGQYFYSITLGNHIHRGMVFLLGK